MFSWNLWLLIRNASSVALSGLLFKKLTKKMKHVSNCSLLAVLSLVFCFLSARNSSKTVLKHKALLGSYLSESGSCPLLQQMMTLIQLLFLKKPGVALSCLFYSEFIQNAWMWYKICMFIFLFPSPPLSLSLRQWWLRYWDSVGNWCRSGFLIYLCFHFDCN